MDIQVTVGPVTLETVIGTQRYYNADEDEWVDKNPITLGDAVAERVFKDIKTSQDPDYRTLKRQVSEVRELMIREILGPIIRDAINKPLQLTNGYGEPTGKMTTLNEMIVTEVGRVLKEPADRHSSSRGTLLQDIVRTVVTDTLKTELAEVVKEQKAAAVTLFRESAAKLLTDAMEAVISGTRR